MVSLFLQEKMYLNPSTASLPGRSGVRAGKGLMSHAGCSQH